MYIPVVSFKANTNDWLKIQMDVPDLMSWLIESSEKTEKSQRKASEALLESDSRLIVVAGR